jgi:pimeloyl-ACP methyl ester carboxylesterase
MGGGTISKLPDAAAQREEVVSPQPMDGCADLPDAPVLRGRRRPCHEHDHHPRRHRNLLQGLGEGRPVVFSHGWPLSADIWDDQLLFLARNGFRVITHDRRGHGRSSQPSGGNDMNTYADIWPS